MINLDDCIKLGKLSKPHGIRGQLVLKLAGLDFEELKELEQVFLLIDGLPVPFFISAYAVRTSDTLIISLEDINTEEAARKLNNTEVLIHSKFLKEVDPDIENISRFYGFTVIDTEAGKIGILQDILSDTQNPLMVVMDGKKEILIPLQDEFIQHIDNSAKVITISCPAGLLDIYK